MKFKEWFYCYVTVSQVKDLRNFIGQECCITEQTWCNWIIEKYAPNRLVQKKCQRRGEYQIRQLANDSILMSKEANCEIHGTTQTVKRTVWGVREQHNLCLEIESIG